MGFISEEVLEENIQTVFDSGLTSDMDFETASNKKRNRIVPSKTRHLTYMLKN